MSHQAAQQILYPPVSEQESTKTIAFRVPLSWIPAIERATQESSLSKSDLFRAVFEEFFLIEGLIEGGLARKPQPQIKRVLPMPYELDLDESFDLDESDDIDPIDLAEPVAPELVEIEGLSSSYEADAYAKWSDILDAQTMGHPGLIEHERSFCPIDFPGLGAQMLRVDLRPLRQGGGWMEALVMEPQEGFNLLHNEFPEMRVSRKKFIVSCPGAEQNEEFFEDFGWEGWTQHWADRDFEDSFDGWYAERDEQTGFYKGDGKVYRFDIYEQYVYTDIMGITREEMEFNFVEPKSLLVLHRANQPSLTMLEGKGQMRFEWSDDDQQWELSNDVIYTGYGRERKKISQEAQQKLWLYEAQVKAAVVGFWACVVSLSDEVKDLLSAGLEPCDRAVLKFAPQIAQKLSNQISF
jgi:hypothetical protein